MFRPFSGGFTIKITTSWGDPFHQLIDHTLHLQHLQVVPAPRPETWFLDSRGPSVRTSHHLGPANKNPWCLFKIGLSSWPGLSGFVFKWIFSTLQAVSCFFSWDMMYTYSFYNETSPAELFSHWPFRHRDGACRGDRERLGQTRSQKQEATDLPDIS